MTPRCENSIKWLKPDWTVCARFWRRIHKTKKKLKFKTWCFAFKVKILQYWFLHNLQLMSFTFKTEFEIPHYCTFFKYYLHLRKFLLNYYCYHYYPTHKLNGSISWTRGFLITHNFVFSAIMYWSKLYTVYLLFFLLSQE